VVVVVVAVGAVGGRWYRRGGASATQAGHRSMRYVHASVDARGEMKRCATDNIAVVKSSK